MKWKSLLYVIGMVTLISIPTFFFIIKGRQANVFFKEKDLEINAIFLDSEVFDGKLHLLYTKPNELIYQEHKFTGDIINHFSMEIPNPMNLDIYVYNSTIYGTYQSDGTIFFLDVAKEISTPFFEGDYPRLFSNAGSLYLSFLREKYLYIHKFEQPMSLWIVDTGVDRYTITETFYRTYISYTKSGQIHYRICNNNAWYQIHAFIDGNHPTLVPIEDEINYLYYATNHTLNVGYGISVITHTKEIFAGDISSITARYNPYKDNALVSFVSQNIIYLQEIHYNGISDFIEIGEGSEPQIHVYDNMIIILYRIGMNFFSKIIQGMNNEFIDFYPIKLDSLQVTQPDFSSWKQNYNTYYGHLWTEQFETVPPALKWFVEHPFETTVILFIVILLMLIIGIWAILFLRKQFMGKKLEGAIT